MEFLFGMEEDRNDPRAPAGFQAPTAQGPAVDPRGMLVSRPPQNDQTQAERGGNSGAERERNWLRPADLLRDRDERDRNRDAEGEADGPEEIRRDADEMELPLNWQNLREELPLELTRGDEQNRLPGRSPSQSESGAPPLPAPSQVARPEPSLRVDPGGRDAPTSGGGGMPTQRPSALPPAMRMAPVGAPASRMAESAPAAEPRLQGTREVMADIGRRFDPPAPASPAARMERLPSLPPAVSVMPSFSPETLPQPARMETAPIQPLDIRRFGDAENRQQPREQFRGGL